MRAQRSGAPFMRGFRPSRPPCLRGAGGARHGAWGKSSFMRSLNSPPRDIAADGEGGGRKVGPLDFLSAGGRQERDDDGDP